MAKSCANIRSLVEDVEISGKVVFEQASYESPTVLKGEITGLTPGKHGIFIHVFGDVDSAKSLGGVFNPYGNNHGAPDDEERQVGGLGNIEVSAEGKCTFQVEDKLLKLIGPQSVIGRSFAIYEKEDDLGKGGAETSYINGNAGEVIACGVIGIVP